MAGEEFKKVIKRIKQWSFVLSVVLCLVAMSQTAQAFPSGGYAHPEVLLQPEELKALIDRKEPSLRIIDVREKLQYLSGHIPGAVQVWRPNIEDKMHETGPPK